MPDYPIRKTIHHFNDPGHAHLLTFSCYKRQPLLTNDAWRAWLSLGIDNSIAAQQYHLVAFVYMPEHVHLVVLPLAEKYDISTLLSAIKRPFSFRVKRDLQVSGSPMLDRLTIRDRPGRKSFRFWQEGPGSDRNITHFKTLLDAAEYVHNNPVRRGLCGSPDEWTWSSWRHYHKPDKYDLSRLPRIHGIPF